VVIVALTFTSAWIVNFNQSVIDGGDTLRVANASGASASESAAYRGIATDAGVSGGVPESAENDTGASQPGVSTSDRSATNFAGVTDGEEAAASPKALSAEKFEAVSGGALASLESDPADGAAPDISGAAVTSQAYTTSAGAATGGNEPAPPAPETDDVATTAPAVKSLSLDADELLFGKLGAGLRLKAKLRPKNAYKGDLKYKSSDESVAVVTSDGAVRSKGWGTCVVTVSSGEKKAECKVTVAKKWVALTFDDGPGRYTDKLLKAMKKQGVRGTFFVVGQMAKPRASTLKKIAKNGNEIANHTYAHNGTEGALMNGLKKTDKVVKKATGKNTKLMRPPGGAINSVTRRCGKPIILWSVDPKDWRDRNSNTVYNRVMSETKSGGIVLLHDIHPTSVDAAIRIMKSMKQKGYAFVTVSELLRDPEDNKVYNKGPKKVRTMKIKYR
jgi:peptidoglycan/xylan/chitin deacetylase (PgdA/CDA1 family)